MTRLLRGYGLSGSKLADILGVSRPTGLKKLVSPEYLTLGDLFTINRKAHIPMDELRAAIK